MTWRERYRPEIIKIIKENGGKTVKELRIILYKANPGYYHHMKRTWSDESLKQLGLKKRKNREYNKIMDPKQTKLFNHE